MYTIYFVPPIYSLTRNGELTSPSPSWSNFWWTRTSKRKKKCREFNKDGRLFIIRRLNITQESARGEEEARGDRANLHMAETCGWKLSTSLHGDFVGYLLRGVKHIYIYRAVYLLIRVQGGGGGQKRFAASSSLLDISRGWTIGSSFYEPNPPGINKMFWSILQRFFHSILFSRKREKTRRSICTFKRLSSLLFTFVY